MSTKQIANSLLNMMRESILTQSFITIVLISACTYLWCTGQDVPKELFYTTSSVVGFFFGGKYQQLLHRGAK